jgi:CHAT domain-containing protein
LLVAGPGTDRGDQEVQAIAAMHEQPIVLTGEAATPAATLAAFSHVSTAHLAVHGRHRSDNALFSSLELSGGPLLGYDLQQVERLPATVILSACDLGLADVRPGDETIGMATALLSAGSATVIASVSRVADDVAMSTMIRYHQAIAAGSGPAAALASAVPAAGPVGFICLGTG